MMPLLLFLFLWCSAGVQDASGGFDMMKEHCSGHISLIWKGRETPAIKDQDGYISICPLTLETSWVQALTCIKLNNSVWENLREYNRVFFLLSLQCCDNLVPKHCSFITVWRLGQCQSICHFSRLCLPQERNGNPVWQSPHSAKTIVSQATGHLAG